jgi:hypothetical protein
VVLPLATVGREEASDSQPYFRQPRLPGNANLLGSQVGEEGIGDGRMSALRLLLAYNRVCTHMRVLRIQSLILIKGSICLLCP